MLKLKSLLTVGAVLVLVGCSDPMGVGDIETGQAGVERETTRQVQQPPADTTGRGVVKPEG